MLRLVAILAVLQFAAPPLAAAQTGTAARSVEPFKVGTFAFGATSSVGIVPRDRLVIDLVQANAALEKSRSYPRRVIPSDMVALIAVTRAVSRDGSTPRRS